MDKPHWSILWINKSNGQLTLKYIAIILVLIHYLLLAGAIGLEYCISRSKSDAITERLNINDLQLNRHIYAVNQYPIGALTCILLLLMENIGIFISSWIDTLEKSGKYLLAVIGIIIIEWATAAFSEIVEIDMIGSLSNFKDKLNIGNTIIFLMVTSFVFLPTLSDMPEQANVYVPAVISFMSLNTLFIERFGSTDVVFGKMNSVFDVWAPFQGEFSKTVTDLLNKADFPKESCVVVYSKSKYIIENADVIMIPAEVLRSYKDDALVGYIAFVLAEHKLSSSRAMEFYSYFNRIISDIVFMVLVKVIQKQKLGISEIFKALKITRSVTFLLTIFVNYLGRCYESDCDELVVNWGYKESLIKYIKAISFDSDVIQSPIYCGLIKIFSSRNSLESRLSRINTMSGAISGV